MERRRDEEYSNFDAEDWRATRIDSDTIDRWSNSDNCSIVRHSSTRGSMTTKKKKGRMMSSMSTARVREVGSVGKSSYSMDDLAAAVDGLLMAMFSVHHTRVTANRVSVARNRLEDEDSRMEGCAAGYYSYHSSILILAMMITTMAIALDSHSMLPWVVGVQSFHFALSRRLVEPPKDSARVEDARRRMVANIGSARDDSNRPSHRSDSSRRIGMMMDDVMLFVGVMGSTRDAELGNLARAN